MIKNYGRGGYGDKFKGYERERRVTMPKRDKVESVLESWKIILENREIFLSLKNYSSKSICRKAFWLTLLERELSKLLWTWVLSKDSYSGRVLARKTKVFKKIAERSRPLIKMRECLWNFSKILSLKFPRNLKKVFSINIYIGIRSKMNGVTMVVEKLREDIEIPRQMTANAAG